MKEKIVKIDEEIGRFQRIIFSYSPQEFLEIAKSMGINISLPPPSVKLIKPFPTIEKEMTDILEKMDKEKRKIFVDRLEKLSRE